MAAICAQQPSRRPCTRSCHEAHAGRFDEGASYTRAVSITVTRIGGSRSSGLWSDSRDLQLSNVVFYTTSYAGAGAAPVMRLGAATNDAMLSNIQCEEFGGAARASYCLQIDRGRPACSRPMSMRAMCAKAPSKVWAVSAFRPSI
jgi:hypothetical protein